MRPQAVDAAPVGEEQQVGMRRGGDDVGDVVLVAQAGPLHAPAAPALAAEGVGVDALDVAGGRQGDHQLLVVDELEVLDGAGVEDDLGPPGRGEGLAYLGQLGLDHAPQAALVGQDGLELGDRLPQLGQLPFELGAAQAGEADERHVEDVVGLDLAELERRGHEPGAGRFAIVGGPDEGDDLVDHVEGLQKAVDDVGPGLGLAQAELAPAGDDLDLVVDVGAQRLGEVQSAGNSVDQRNHVHPEAGLQGGVLEQVVEHHVGVGVAL